MSPPFSEFNDKSNWKDKKGSKGWDKAKQKSFQCLRIWNCKSWKPQKNVKICFNLHNVSPRKCSAIFGGNARRCKGSKEVAGCSSARNPRRFFETFHKKAVVKHYWVSVIQSPPNRRFKLFGPDEMPATQQKTTRTEIVLVLSSYLLQNVSNILSLQTYYLN